jgi:hypothetical protein
MSSSVRAAGALFVLLALCAAAANAKPYHHAPVAARRVPYSTQVAFMGYLRDKRVATVYTDGRVHIAPQPLPANADRRTRILSAVKRMHDPSMRATDTRVSTLRYGSLAGTVTPSQRARILFDLDHPPQPYVSGRVVVVFKNGVTMPQDHQALTPAATATLVRGVLGRNKAMTPHAFTTDARTNQTLMGLGVDKADRLFAKLDRGTLSSMRLRAQSRSAKALLPIENAFVLHVAASSVENAVRALRSSTAVAYVSPDYTVSPMIAGWHPLPDAVTTEIAGYRRVTKTFGRSIKAVSPSTLPSNAAVQFNVQAMLGATGVDAVAAYDEIQRAFGQLPGTGEIITNIGPGDVTDASAATNANDPCQQQVQFVGPTTHLIGGQHYLDFPSLPLIPVWVSDADGNLSASDEACYVDAQLGEVGLDFAVMAPLPHDQQRPGEIGSGAGDLLGIAPGASYRWVAPGTTTGNLGLSDLAGAFIGAARQVPAPNVITASIGWGADFYGFPGRYLEDDPVMQSVVSSVVASGVVVCIAGNDGTRLYQASAVGPSGGSAPTNAGTAGATTLDDVYYTTMPSVVPDDGAIDVGASTLDDIIAVNPQDATGGALAGQSTFAATRYNGTLSFSSAFGTRVNLSAPGDNIQALYKAGAAYDAAGTDISGGTSASAPEVAAAAAVAMQVARLTGHPFASPAAVRDALVATATPVANPPQLDVVANVGPQVSVRRVVEQLLAAAGKPVAPGIARVAVHGRRDGSFIAQVSTAFHDSVFVTALDPAFVKLDGPYAWNLPYTAFPGTDTGADLNSYITIAPDWEGIPANATFRLAVAGRPGRVLATTPRLRMLPAQLLAAAGMPLTPGATRTLSLTYTASVGLHVVAESTFQITFGPPAASSRLILAPVVPPVVSGATIPVTYDVSAYPASLARSATLNVSVPGEGSTYFQDAGPAGFLYPYYSTALPSAPRGTVNVPVSSLAGGGVYTVWIDMQPGNVDSDISDLAFTRVDAGTARPPAPLLSSGSGQPGWHSLAVPYKSTFAVTYDVSNVPRATGAIVELSAPPPAPSFHYGTLGSGLNTFRNPNGSRLDDDGAVTGSIYHQSVSGVSGTVTIDPAAAGVPATAPVNVRVVPTSGGVPVAEASDAGTVRYLGIEPALGVPIGNAYMNPSGTDGFLSEGAAFGTSQQNVGVLTYEPFDTTTGTVSGIPLSFTTTSSIFFPIVQNDTAIAETAIDNVTMNYERATPLEAPFAQFTLPPGTFSPSVWLLSSGTNSSPTRSAYLGLDVSSGAILVAAGDITTGAFTPAVDVTSILGPNVDSQAIFALAYDPNADRAYIINEDSTLPCVQQSPQLVTVDFGTLSASSRTLPIGAGTPGLGQGYQMAIDPATHTAAVATSCADYSRSTAVYRAELTLVDLTSGATSRVFQHNLDYTTQTHGIPAMPGGDSSTIGIDPVNHLVLQRSVYCPQLISWQDVNARPCLNEYDLHGTLVKTVPGLFSNGFIDFGTVFNGVNGTTRTGVADGQEGYTLSIESFDVQPYAY